MMRHHRVRRGPLTPPGDDGKPGPKPPQPNYPPKPGPPRPPKRWLAGLGALAILPFAIPACSHDQPADIYEGLPHISVIAVPPPFEPYIRVTDRIYVHHEPRTFHLVVSLFKYGHLGHLVHVGDKSWDRDELPLPGHSEVLRADFYPCSAGRFFTQWITTGISHDGVHEHITAYWPFPGWHSKDRAKWRPEQQPSRKDSWPIKHC